MRLLVTGGAGYIGSIVAACLLDAGHDVVVLDDLDWSPRCRAGRRRVRQAGVTQADRCSPVPGSTRSCISPPSRWSPNPSPDRSCTGRTTWSARCGCCGPCATPVSTVGLLVNGRDLRHAGGVTNHRGHTGCPDQPVRPDQARHRPRHRRRGGRPRAGRRQPALLQRRRVVRRPRRAARPGDAPDPQHPCRPGRPTGVVEVFGWTTRPATALPSATTCMSRIWPMRTCWPLTPPLPGQHRVYNLGTGTGYTVREVIEACRPVTGHPGATRRRDRRPGDPPPWSPRGAGESRPGMGAPQGLERIVADAWSFVRR